MIYKIYYEGKRKFALPVKNREELMALRNSKANVDTLAKVRQGDASAKPGLLQLAYNIGHVEGALAGCKSIGSYFFHDVDCYGSEHSQQTKELILSKKDEIGLKMLERSASGGWHLVCERHRGTTILENQVRVATILQLEMDTSAKDLQRVVFSTSGSEEDLPYLDDCLFEEPMTAEECEKEFNMLKVRVMRGQEQVPAGAKKANKHYKPWEEDEMSDVRSKKALATRGTQEDVKFEPSGNTYPDNYHGIPFTAILKKYWEVNNSGYEPTQGDRDTLTYQLACDLRHICGRNFEWLDQVIPCYDGFPLEEKRAKIKSALSSEFNGFPARLRNTLNALDIKCTVGSVLGKPSEQARAPLCNSEGDMNQRLWEWGAEIEELSKDFPLLKDICKGLKKNQYPAALFVAGGLMMTLMTRCTYRFYHRPEELRRLNNSTLIIGDPASGKSFATRLFKLLASPIVAADKVGKDAINAYREQMRTKGANKEKPKKPKVVVRIHPARTSNAQFIQDMVNAVEEVNGEPMQLHMLTFDTELDNTLSLQKGGAYIDKQALQLKAFHNEEDGQAYSNVDSVFQEFYVIWNFIYTGTPIALKKMVNEQNFGSGLATRLTCIPLPATNFQMMSRESTVDYDSDNRLKEWAEKLDRMKGELSVQKIVDELYDWTARRMADAAENDSKADEMLLKRCAYHGLNFAAPFIVMRHWDKMKQDGQYWCGEFETDEVDWKLAELIVNIQYACQRHYFGAMAEAYFDNKLKDASVNVQRRQKTYEAFSRLPEEFTIDDVMRCFGLAQNNSARARVFRLIKDGLIEKVDEFVENGTTKAKYKKTGTVMI
ncbi:hypothetical protein [Prevotella sp. E13-27]|uniref:hypothetical protein n=1 Tax=Prevotella sp. E13-27 TaxID=2938122 RepID=UPI00200AACCC|nr:hypothetical protein [Prevotella sp. E13-27]MCK8623015.1 hypothetical protein [Prevotella sp. E13-27]